MVIGTGLVARNFMRYEAVDEFLVFASGVSNSKSISLADKKREEELFASTVHAHRSKRFIYFSTSSINDPDLQGTPYINHKLEMEDRVRQLPSYNIFRLSNLAGFSDNASTILNFFYNCVASGETFNLWKYSERNIIDVWDVYRVCDHILQQHLFSNEIINIANPENYPVDYVVKCVESFIGKKANYVEIEKGEPFGIDVSVVAPVYEALQIRFGEDYLPCLLEKYYSKK